MLRTIIVIASLLVIASAPLAEAKRPAQPGQSLAHAHGAHGQGRGGPHEPATVEPSPSPVVEPAPTAVAPAAPASPLPDEPSPQAPKSEPTVRERARQLLLDLGTSVSPTLPPIQAAGVGSIAAPEGATRPAWTWLLPAIGLVSVGIAVFAAAGRAPRTRRAGADAGSAEPAVALSIHRLASPNVPSLLHAGRDALRAGRVAEAAAWFTQATKLEPRLHVAHFSRGVCLAGLDRHDDAYWALRKAHELDPREGAYRFELARAAARTGREREAMDQLSPLLRLAPELAGPTHDDDAFARLRDHPRFLMLVGRL